MMKLLFCTAAVLPIGIVPWIISEPDQMDIVIQDASYSELVTDPNIEALSNCDVGELPVFFRDGLVTMHSAEFITDGLDAAEDCGPVDVTIIPILPTDAGDSDIATSVIRTAELSDYVEAVSELSDVDVDLDVADTPREDDISTLYINGRAAILRIDPEG